MIHGGVVWDPPESDNAEHQRLYHYVYEDFVHTQVDFLVTTLPDADPDYLEEMVRNSQGKFRSVAFAFVSELDSSILNCR